jgi:hypothetical protein
MLVTSRMTETTNRAAKHLGDTSCSNPQLFLVRLLPVNFVTNTEIV